MELGSILQFLENRSILVTGATGFLAKIFIEKILRVQPHVKKLYLLLRASDANSAMQRFNTEIIGKELFKVLKEKNGENLSALISEKVRVVAGDITLENLGVKDPFLLEEMLGEVDVVVNLAATTNFDERYDISLGINTLGAKHVLNFSKKCSKLKILVHVSTAYVSGEREGLIMETPYKMGETLNGTRGLDIDAEKKLIEETLKQLKADNYSEESITSAMKDLGIQRARKYGWPNTYVYTKAMGEMILGELKEEIPLVIIRPTIVTSTYREPFPGWVEGVRTIDSLAVGYGKGRLTCFLGDPTTIVDVIPADMVVNAIIVAMAAHADEGGEASIYHVGSSVSNPVEFTWIQDYGLRHFTAHPWIDKNGKPVIVGKVTVFNTMESFHKYMTIRYFLPLKGLKILNAACCQYFKKSYVEQCKKIKFVMRLIELYAPYLFFKGFYDDMNSEKLRIAAEESGVEMDIFYFDPKIINWDDYFMNTHIPGVVKRVFRNKYSSRYGGECSHRGYGGPCQPSRQQPDYHVGLSVSNPVESPWLQNSFFRYFTARPLIDRNSNPVIVGKITPLPSVESFQRRMNIRYLLPLKGLQVLNTACCQYFQKFYLEQLRKSRFVVRLIELYEPYLFFKGVFDDMNMEKLKRAAAEESSGVEADIFYFDPKGKNWDDYFINTHIPGVVKTIIKK